MKANVYSCPLCHHITFKEAPENPENAPIRTIKCPSCESVASWKATVTLPPAEEET